MITTAARGLALAVLSLGASSPAICGSSGAGTAPGGAATCKIEPAGSPSDNANGTVSGVWVRVGEVYHFGDLSLRVNKRVEDGRYDVDLKAPDLDAVSWFIAANAGPVKVKACGVDVSIAILRNGHWPEDAFVVGVF